MRVRSTMKTRDMVLTMMGTLRQGHMSTVAHLASKGPLELPGLQCPHQVGASPSLLVYGVLPSGTAVQAAASLQGVTMWYPVVVEHGSAPRGS